PEVDVDRERAKRHPPLAVPVAPSQLRTAGPALHPELHALSAGPHGLHQRLLDGPPKRDPLLQLGRDVLRHQLRAELRLLDLLNRHPNAFSSDLLQLVAKLIDAGATFADDDAWFRGVKRDGQG